MRYFRYFTVIILLLTVFSVCCLGTSEKITIQSFEFYEYVDEDNNKNEDLLTAKIEFSSPIDAKQFSILLMSENLTELNSTNVGKVIYIDQFASVQNGVFEFTVEKNRIASALGTTDIDGCILYAKIGGMGIDEATLMSVVYSAPRADILYGDATG
ncbi:MAG: hypothetical protein IJO52_11955, partial [Clostridia bacterium]|nr:hypothetical protein [Clostridia bacterium]